MEPVNGSAEDGWWRAKLDVPEKDMAKLEYKFVVLRDGGNNRWEECNNRVVSVEVPPKPCSVCFTDFWAYPLVSKHEVVGNMLVVEKKVEKKPEPVVEKKVEKKPEPVVEKKPEPVVEKKVEKKAEPVVEKKVEKKPEPVVEKKVEKKAEPVVEKKVEKKAEPVVEKKAEPVVEKKVEKKPEPVVEKKVEKKAEPVVEKKPEPVVEKKAEPVVEKKVEKKTSPVVEKKTSPVIEPAPAAEKKAESKNKRRSLQIKPDEDPKRETVTLRHVEPEAKPQKQQPKHKKSGSIVEDCKKVFEPEGTPVEVPQFLRNSMKGSSSSSKLLAQYK